MNTHTATATLAAATLLVIMLASCAAPSSRSLDGMDRDELASTLSHSSTYRPTAEYPSAAAFQSELRRRLCYHHSIEGEQRDRVMRGDIRRGDPSRMVLACWGMPDHSTRSQTPEGEWLHWSWEGNPSRSATFLNDKLFWSDVTTER